MKKTTTNHQKEKLKTLKTKQAQVIKKATNPKTRKKQKQQYLCRILHMSVLLFTTPYVSLIFPFSQRNAGVRTKYDKMFQRKNQNVLSDHYSKLIDSGFDNTTGADSDDEFITLKRADHELPQSLLDLDPTEDLSKRKQKLSKAKKALATGGNNSKLIFDDEGKAHELYELADGEDWMKEKGGLEGAMKEGKKFAMEEREKMSVADVVDKAEAREKRKERKRKRKEMEKMVSFKLPSVANVVRDD